MDVKDAVRTAKEYLTDLYVEEEIVNVGLEEVRYDDEADKWYVTIGFSRPWDQRIAMMVRSHQAGLIERSYKELCIDDITEEVESLTTRSLGSPQTV